MTTSRVANTFSGWTCRFIFEVKPFQALETNYLKFLVSLQAEVSLTCKNGVQCEVKVSVAFSIQPDNVQIDVKNNVDVDVNVDDNVDVKLLQVQPSFDLALTVLPRESGKLIFLSWRYLCLNRGSTQFLRKTTGTKTFFRKRHC